MTSNNMQPVKYGLIVFAAIWFAGWSTGMGGSPLPNLLFSVAMGLFAGGLFWLIQKYHGKRDE